ncbi:MAG: hypothetical protein ABI680_04285 [Chthoniobacteraceae bacterium]
MDTRTGVAHDYQLRFKFTGKPGKVTLILKPMEPDAAKALEQKARAVRDAAQ